MAGGGRLKETRSEESPRQASRSDRQPRDRKPYGKERRNERAFSDRHDRYSRSPRPGDRRDSLKPEQLAEPENPFALRRNPHALKSIGDKKPSLPPQSGPLMRSRGWKKRDADNNSENN